MALADSGERIDDDLKPTVQYSDAAVIRLIDKVRRSVERPAKDASVKIDAAGVSTIPGVEGLAVSASQLHRQIGAAITSTTAPRSFVAETRHTQPKVTTAELKRRYDTVIVVNRGQFRLRLFKDLKGHPDLRHRGRAGRPRDAGRPVHDRQQGHQPRLARAQQRVGRQAGRQGHRRRRPQQTRSRRAGWGSSTASASTGPSDDASIGHNASHGCIRMHVPDVEKLYDEVPVGSAVYIA